MQIARATQRPGQTKEQTKLIAAGIQKGIDQYKKQHKAKLREIDKRRKKEQKSNQASDDITEQQDALNVEQETDQLAPLDITWLSPGLYLLSTSLFFLNSKPVFSSIPLLLNKLHQRQDDFKTGFIPPRQGGGILVSHSDY